MAEHPPHPAKYSDGIVDLFREILLERIAPGELVVDPFAGTGRIHELHPMFNTLGVEIEPEWASMHTRTIVGDSRMILGLVGRHLWPTEHRLAHEVAGAIATSCTYGNRMADHHEARDGSDRLTYRHKLGRPLRLGNTGQMQWGADYQNTHAGIWGACYWLLRPGGVLLLNVSNHYRKGARGPYALDDHEVNVTGWHVDCIEDLGLDLIDAYAVRTRRMRKGANASRRVPFEFVLVFRKPHHQEGE